MYIRSNYVMFLILILTVVIVAATQAQTDTAKHNSTRIGIAAAVQGEQLDIMVPCWLSQHFVVTPSAYARGSGGNYVDWGAAVAARYNLRTGDAVPYLGVGFGILNYRLRGEGDLTDIELGPLGGGEYFLDEHFSVGVEARLNFAFSDSTSYRFNNPGGLNVNTAAAVIVTFYF